MFTERGPVDHCCYRSSRVADTAFGSSINVAQRRSTYSTIYCGYSSTPPSQRTWIPTFTNGTISSMVPPITILPLRCNSRKHRTAQKPAIDSPVSTCRWGAAKYMNDNKRKRTSDENNCKYARFRSIVYTSTPSNTHSSLFYSIHGQLPKH